MPTRRLNDISEIEAQLALSPESVDLRERLLEVCAADESLASRPSRTATILWFISSRPDHFFCLSPFVSIDPDRYPHQFAEVRAAWLAQVEHAPDDAWRLRAAAFFVSHSSKPEARELLDRAARIAPSDPEVQIDLGRLVDDPSERFRFYSRARDLGSTHETLPVLRAVAAAECGSPEAQVAALELLERAGEDEACLGPATAWMETGRQLWERARRDSKDDREARAKTSAIARRSYYRHWGHTLLGLLALEAGDAEAAVAQLALSRAIQHDFRLDAYGPAPHLLRALCAAGYFEEVCAHLRAWLAFSQNDRAREWLDLAESRRVPALQESG